MTPEWLEKVLATFTRLAPLPSFVLAGTTALCLFAADSFLERLGLRQFRDNHRQVVGVVFLVSTLYLVGHLSIWGWRKAAFARGRKRAKAADIQRLHRLTPDEQAVLELLLSLGSRTHKFAYGDDAVTSLYAAGILNRPQQIALASARPGGIVAEVTYVVADWAWDYLNEHPEVLGIERKEDAREGQDD